MTGVVDKSIIVTGGGSGIGAATALRLARGGARITVADVADEAGTSVVEQIRAAGGRAQHVHVDVSDPDQVEAMVAEAVSAYGRLDGASNNAGLAPFSSARRGQFPLADLPPEAFLRAVSINVLGTFHCLRHEIRAMLGTGGGSIVNTASGAAVFAVPNSADYVATKHAVLGLSRAAALDYATRGVRVNAILPGTIDTPMVAESAGDDEDFRRTWSASMPIGRLGHPEEVAEGTAWLLSDEASLVTGSAMAVDGGQTMV